MKKVFGMPIKVDPSMPPNEIRIDAFRVTNLFVVDPAELYDANHFDAAWAKAKAKIEQARIDAELFRNSVWAAPAYTSTNPNIVLEPKPLYGTHFVGQKPVIDAAPATIDGKKVWRT